MFLIELFFVLTDIWVGLLFLFVLYWIDLFFFVNCLMGKIDDGHYYLLLTYLREHIWAEHLQIGKISLLIHINILFDYELGNRKLETSYIDYYYFMKIKIIFRVH